MGLATLFGIASLTATMALGLGGVPVVEDVCPGRGWVSQGGTPHGTVCIELIGQRHALAWAASELNVRPLAVAEIAAADVQARFVENRAFHQGAIGFASVPRIQYDNGPDAFRHIYGSALAAYRLVRRLGMDPGDAEEMFMAAADAHERDTWLHLRSPAHAQAATRMDTVNNMIGVRVGLDLAQRHAATGMSRPDGEDAIRAATIAAIMRGSALVLDHVDDDTRGSRVSDIAVLDASGEVRRDANGSVMLRQDTQDAAGFPAPLNGHVVDLNMRHIVFDPASSPAAPDVNIESTVIPELRDRVGISSG